MLGLSTIIVIWQSSADVLLQREQQHLKTKRKLKGACNFSHRKNFYLPFKKSLYTYNKNKHTYSIVAQVYNPSYLGSGNKEASGSRAFRQKKVHRTPYRPINAVHGGTCLSSQLRRKLK
jgi:hypothetical protein